MRNLQALQFGTYVKLTLMVWLAMVAFDFLVHAGVLAPLYLEPSPFLLPPKRSFALIPVGYLSHLFLAFLLIWLMARLDTQGWRQGAVFALQLGLLLWGTLVLGLFSISTATPALLAGWFVGRSLELGIAGMVAGSGFAEPHLGKLFIKVLVFAIGAFVLTVVLQSTGLAPIVSY